ncbi:MAG TPA: hypothetical protein VFG41_09215 [Sphingomicrobium sp.]|jgi:hypothetical protein|nr:hypothetical protein [Sphingomicrobium sp.]
MANPVKGEAQLRDYTLAFNFGVFCALEDKLGKKMPEILQSVAAGLGFGELRDFVYLGLRTHHPDTTEDDALKLLDEVGYKTAALAVSKAVAGFFGEERAKGKNPTRAAR